MNRGRAGRAGNMPGQARPGASLLYCASVLPVRVHWCWLRVHASTYCSNPSQHLFAEKDAFAQQRPTHHPTTHPRAHPPPNHPPACPPTIDIQDANPPRVAIGATAPRACRREGWCMTCWTGCIPHSVPHWCTAVVPKTCCTTPPRALQRRPPSLLARLRLPLPSCQPHPPSDPIFLLMAATSQSKRRAYSVLASASRDSAAASAGGGEATRVVKPGAALRHQCTQAKLSHLSSAGLCHLITMTQ